MSRFSERFVSKVEAPPAAIALKLDGPYPTAIGGWKWTGQCPACAKDGKDRAGNHLAVFEDGKIACITQQGEAGAQHRSRMVKLCPALRGDGNPTGDIYIAPDLTAEREAVKAMAGFLLGAICEELRGDISSLGKSGIISTDPLWQFACYCDLFLPDDLIWVGHLKDAGPMGMSKDKETGEIETWETKPYRLFSRHLFQAGDLAEREMMFRRAYADRLDLTRCIAWNPGSLSRSRENVLAMRLAVVEHDNLSKADQIALLRYVRDVLQWELRMVIDTTGKSFHGLFDVSNISPEVRTAQAVLLENMGVDSHSLRSSATRCPGLIRQKCPDKPNKPHGDMQSILWVA